MLLDAVLDDGKLMWLSTEADRSRYFLLRLAEYRFAPRCWKGKRGVNGPGSGLRLSPQGSFTPRVSLFYGGAPVVLDCPEKLREPSAPIGR